MLRQQSLNCAWNWSRQIFGDAKDILPEFPQTCPKNLCAVNFPRFLEVKKFFWRKKIKKGRAKLFYSVRLIGHSNRKQRCRNISAEFSRYFALIFWDFCRIINKSKLLGLRLHPLLLPKETTNYGFILPSKTCQRHLETRAANA